MVVWRGLSPLQPLFTKSQPVLKLRSEISHALGYARVLHLHFPRFTIGRGDVTRLCLAETRAYMFGISSRIALSTTTTCDITCTAPADKTSRRRDMLSTSSSTRTFKVVLLIRVDAVVVLYGKADQPRFKAASSLPIDRLIAVHRVVVMLDAIREPRPIFAIDV